MIQPRPWQPRPWRYPVLVAGIVVLGVVYYFVFRYGYTRWRYKVQLLHANRGWITRYTFMNVKGLQTIHIALTAAYLNERAATDLPSSTLDIDPGQEGNFDVRFPEECATTSQASRVRAYYTIEYLSQRYNQQHGQWWIDEQVNPTTFSK